MNSSAIRISVPVIGAAILGGGLLAAGAAPASAAELSTASPVVSQKDIAKYHLSKKQIKDISTAKKFANTTKAKQVRWRESNNRYTARSGKYTGAWQFDGQTWRSHGGKQFSKEAAKAPKWAQDYVMWRTRKSRGWQPWGG